MLKLSQRKTGWFTVPLDESGETKLHVQQLLPGDLRQIYAEQEQFVTVLGEGSDGELSERQREIRHNNLGINQARFNKALIGWEGFKDEEGSDLPVNAHNKGRLFVQFPELLDVVDESLSILAGNKPEPTEEVKAKN